MYTIYVTLIIFLIVQELSVHAQCANKQFDFSILESRKKEKPIREFLDAADGGRTNLHFVGNGDIQKSISENSDVQANTGLGIIFFRAWPSEDANGRKRIFQNIQFDFVVNVASTSDTLKTLYDNSILRNRRDFGNYILNPVNSKQATFIDFYAYTSNVKEWGNNGKLNWLRNLFSGFNARFIASNSVWHKDTTSVNLSGFLIRAGFFHDFIPDKIRIDKDYSVTAGINYSYRGILGDIRFKENEHWRKELLSSSRVKYHGIEFNFSLRLNNIRAEVQIPAFNYKDGQIIGLTNTQFVTSIRFVGGFPLKIKGNKEDDTDE